MKGETNMSEKDMVLSLQENEEVSVKAIPITITTITTVTIGWSTASNNCDNK